MGQPSAVPRQFGQFVIDALIWGLAICFGVLLRFDFNAAMANWSWVFVYCAMAAVLQGVGGSFVALYRGRYRYGSFDEARPLVCVVVGVGGVLFVLGLLLISASGVPRSTILIALPAAFAMMGAVRYWRRIAVERKHRPGDNAQRALVYGAGHLGENVVRNMLKDPISPYVPVGLIDDDLRRQQLRLTGVPVLGQGTDLEEIAERTGASALIMCIARAEADTVREISDRADCAGLRLLVLPPLEEILEGGGQLTDVRDVRIEDIIGRHPVDTDIASIADYLAGKRVLVTGAGGSIGAELCRQIAKFSPEELIMLDRDESGLQTTQLSILGHGLLNSRDVVLADIRDRDVVGGIFCERRPQVVFHAAALKHLPLLEQYPEEGWKTNVLGTLNVIEAALDIQVDTFVNVSTDKAADATSILGRTKRLGERLTAWAAERTNGTFLSVRFGNVIGSRGSMLPLFAGQIERGGPVTVTHPDVTRYFMTIPEACQLVVQAGGIGRDGEVLILDMGEPIKILDVAKRMINMTGRDIPIEFTGLRPGEKLHEVLIGQSEHDERPLHPKISHASVPGLEPGELPAYAVDEGAPSVLQQPSQS
ncbi:polysaccharide biosynthesis protein [Arthrobacter castelli]|uniref:polysaccharide biosynthesis protein n=1 Tax=Arthrobacter castelli TaxID=271431 RepID=UPI000424D3E1|nr:nucleoside-diphosphate sugar epimerase/dehydratase [Arthrobacter castelli]